MNSNIYQSPLNTRYAGHKVSRNFGSQVKFEIFRRLWLALVEPEKESGPNITGEQIKKLQSRISDTDSGKAAEYEKILRHDVMTHVKTCGEVYPNAAGIIHLGATNCHVTDNTDIIVMRNALEIVEKKLAVSIRHLSDFTVEYKDLSTLGCIHYRPAQLITVGKRATLWIQDFLMDLEEVIYRKGNLKLKGIKRTTGTQASFLKFFDNDHAKVRELEKKIVEEVELDSAVSVSGQTYTRKIDYHVLQVLSPIAQSAHRMTNDIRLLQNRKELEEPFKKAQVGSSAIAYRRNPVRCERISSLAKYVMNLAQDPRLVANIQWLEGTLDDSANKRMSVPENFAAVDSILKVAINVTGGLVVYENQIKSHVNEELPFMATKNISMEAVKRDGDRQELHEKIREYSMVADRRVKKGGLDNNLLELLEEDGAFNLNKDDLNLLLDDKLYIGRCPEQAVEFTEEDVKPVISKYDTEYSTDLKVQKHQKYTWQK